MRPNHLGLLICLTFTTAALPLSAQEQSVKPGINAAYLKEGLIVEEWVERLGQEGREVYDNRHAIVDALGLKPGMVVADIGSGTGVHTPLLASHVLPDGKTYAVDIVPKFLAHIEAQKQANNWTNVETVLCSERSVELPVNSIDVAFICNVYHHFEYPADSLASLHRALRAKGQLVLIDYKRIPGESSSWVLGHMRAGQDVFEAEISTAGFTKVREISDLMKDNYFVIFQKN